MPEFKKIWKKQFTRQLQFFEKIKRAKGELKFDRRYVIPSDIGNQFYCEQKLEQEYLTGKIITDEMVQGVEGHGRIVEDFKPVTMEETWRDIYTKKKTVLAEFIFIAPYKGVFLIGRPDVIFFVGGNPILLFEFKFSKYDSDFLSRHAQAQCYGLIMREIGFDVKNLFYSIVIFKPEMLKARKLIKTIPPKIINDFLRGDFGSVESNSKTYWDVRAYIHKFNGEEAEKHVEWALEYWANKREACCTEQIGKCHSCEYKQECQRFSDWRILDNFTR